jgi:hypothetical protein
MIVLCARALWLLTVDEMTTFPQLVSSSNYTMALAAGSYYGLHLRGLGEGAVADLANLTKESVSWNELVA